jgi:hypothetical protein
MRACLMPRFKGHAQVLTPKKLTEGTNVDLFAAQLSQGAQSVQDVLRWFGVKPFGGSVTLLALPSDLTGEMIGAFPEVGSVKLGKMMELFLWIKRYFGWRVESQLGFCPKTPAPGSDKAGPSGDMRVFATLRWAWFTKGSWGLERAARDAYDMKRTSFAIAARVLKESFRR